MLGFKQYDNLDGLSFMEASVTDPVSSNRLDKTSQLLDMIFVLDPVTNMPTGDISQYLSDKTSDEVRTFIENTLLREIEQKGLEIPSNLRDEYLKLDSEFIAKVSRNRYEPLDQYEQRVSEYLNDLQDSERAADWRKDLIRRLNENSELNEKKS